MVIASGVEIKKNILISCPNLTNSTLFLPYIYGALKTYAEKSEELRRNYSWLKPIYLSDAPDNLLQTYANVKIDVLGLSCYSWNWKLQLEIANKVKFKNPHCLIVFGGPHPKPTEPDFFDKHPYIDLVVKNEGEVVFSDILKKHLSGGDIQTFNEVPGVVNKYNLSQFIPAERLKLSEVDDSPYLCQEDMFKEIIDEVQQRKEELGVSAISGILETNRGCPYGCVFCDWGSLTLSKMSQFSRKRIQDDISAFSKFGIEFMVLTDSNFGIFEQDVEIAQEIASETDERHFPMALSYSPTKSSTKHLLPIVKIFNSSKINFSATLSIQHTDPTVVHAMKRKNLKDKDMIALATEYKKMGVPMWVQLILGHPGDTYDKWFECLMSLLDKNFDGNLIAFPFAILPNAPAADDSFFKKWDIKTHTSSVPSFCGRRKKTFQFSAEDVLVVSSSTFSTEDWIEMWVTFHLFNALHSQELTKFTSSILNQYGVLDQRQLYDVLIHELARTPGSVLYSCANVIRNGLKAFLSEPGHAYYECPLPKSEKLPYLLDYDQWVYAECVENIDSFYSEILEVLLRKVQPTLNFPQWNSLIEFQKHLIVDFRYDSNVGKSFESIINWQGLYLSASARSLNFLHESQRKGPYRIEITQSHIGKQESVPIGWSDFSGEDRIVQWLNEVVHPSFMRYGFNTFSLTSMEVSKQSLQYENLVQLNYF